MNVACVIDYTFVLYNKRVTSDNLMTICMLALTSGALFFSRFVDFLGCKVLTVLEVKALPSPLLNCKSLTLDMADGDLPGIAKLLNISPYPETLHKHRNFVPFRGVSSQNNCPTFTLTYLFIKLILVFAGTI